LVCTARFPSPGTKGSRPQPGETPNPQQASLKQGRFREVAVYPAFRGQSLTACNTDNIKRSPTAFKHISTLIIISFVFIFVFTAWLNYYDFVTPWTIQASTLHCSRGGATGLVVFPKNSVQITEPDSGYGVWWRRFLVTFLYEVLSELDKTNDRGRSLIS